MGKAATPLRQRKVARQPGDDTADDDLLNEAAAESSSEGSKQWWIAVIAVLVLVNVVLGGIHLRKRVSNKQGAYATNIVKTLSDESLPFHIAGHPNGTLVNFHSADCVHCKKLAPEFENAAKELQKISDVSLVSVDARLAPLALKRYSVTRYPTLLWFRRGELLHEAPPSARTSSKIVEFVDQSVQPSVIDFTVRDDFDQAVEQLRSVLTNESLPVVVGFARSPDVYDLLQQAGEKFRGSTAFLFVKEARDDDPYIRAYYRESEGDQDYNSVLVLGDLYKWLQPLMERKTKKRQSS
jgi:thiol-disulfide isomerase/thioredoxin